MGLAIIYLAYRIRDRSRVRGWLAECKQTRKILKFWLFDLPDGQQMHFTFLTCRLYTQKVKIGPVPAPTVPAATCRIGVSGLRIPKFTRQRQLGNTAVKPLAPAYDANWVPTWAGWVPGWVTVGYQVPGTPVSSVSTYLSAVPPFGANFANFGVCRQFSWA